MLHICVILNNFTCMLLEEIFVAEMCNSCSLLFEQMLSFITIGSLLQKSLLKT